MAEITDNIGDAPQLEIMSPRHHQHKMASGDNLGGAKQKADAKLGFDLAKLAREANQIRTQNKLQAIELETNSVNADLNDYYRDADATIAEQLSAMSLQQLGNFDDNWDEGGLVLPDGETTLKPFKISDDVSEESKQFLEPYLKDKDSAFRNNTRKLFSAELKKRAIEDIKIKQQRTVSLLEGQMANVQIEIENSKFGIIAKRKDFHMENTFSGGNFEPANELSRNFKTNVLDPKLKSGQIRQQEADVLLDDYNKMLAHSIFNHYVKYDREKALEIATTKGFSVNGTPLHPDVYTDFVYNKLNDDDTKEKLTRLNTSIQYLKNMSSINPGHLKNYFGEKDAEGNWTGKIRPLNTFTEFDLNKIVEMGFRNEEHFKLEMTKLIAIDDGNLKLKEDSQKKIDDQAFKNRFNSQLTVISNYIKNSNSSELNDFLISQGFVKGSVKKHKIWAASDKQIMNAGEKGGIFTGNEDPDLRHPDKSGNYRGGWTAEKTAKFDLMQTSLNKILSGVQVREAGAGLIDSKWKNLQRSHTHYWHSRILQRREEHKLINPIDDKNSDWQFASEDQKKQLLLRQNGFKAIANFNENDFQLKSPKYLVEKMTELEKEHRPEGLKNPTSAFVHRGVYDTWKDTVLMPRITNLKDNLNATILNDIGLYEKVTNNGGELDDSDRIQFGKHMEKMGMWPTLDGKLMAADDIAREVRRRENYIYVPKPIINKDLLPFDVNVNKNKGK